MAVVGGGSGPCVRRRPGAALIASHPSSVACACCIIGIGAGAGCGVCGVGWHSGARGGVVL